MGVGPVKDDIEMFGGIMFLDIRKEIGTEIGTIEIPYPLFGEKVIEHLQSYAVRQHDICI